MQISGGVMRTHRSPTYGAAVQRDDLDERIQRIHRLCDELESSPLLPEENRRAVASMRREAERLCAALRSDPTPKL
jgi:hypothetical protein